MVPAAEQLAIFRQAIDEVSPIGDACWAEIKTSIYFKAYKKAEHYSFEGQNATDFCLVLSGVFRIYFSNGEGEEWNKYFLQEGNFLSASLSPERSSISNVQALSDAQILCLPYSQLRSASHTYPQINAFLQKLSFNYLEKKHLREVTLLSQNAKDKYHYFRLEFPDLEDKIQHYHIASYLGITPTQLSRLRKKNTL